MLSQLIPLFCIVLLVSSSCTGPQSYCSLPIAPGLETFNEGFNAASLTSAANPIPIFQYTWSSQKTFSPNGLKIKWRVPDQISVSSFPRSIDTTDTSVVTHWSEVVKEVASSDSWSVGIPFVIGSIAIVL